MSAGPVGLSWELSSPRWLRVSCAYRGLPITPTVFWTLALRIFNDFEAGKVLVRVRHGGAIVLARWSTGAALVDAIDQARARGAHRQRAADVADAVVVIVRIAGVALCVAVRQH